MDFYSKMLKKRILMTRLISILTSAVGVGYVFFYYFNLVDQWLCGIMILYTIAMILMFNSNYQEIFSGIKLSKLNLAFAVLFFLSTVALMVYSIVSGNLTL